MKHPICLTQTSHLNEVAQSLSTSQLNDKFEVKISPVFCSSKKSPQSSLIQREYHFERMADGSLQCKKSGLKLPLNHLGEPDWGELVRLVAARKWGE